MAVETDRTYERETFGYFWGLHFSEVDLDEIQSRVSREFRDHDTALFQGKWFDYRAMHPALATLLFAREYKVVFRHLYERHYDRHRARFVNGLKNETEIVGDRRSLNGLWRARQHADALGMPYKLFIALTMETGLRVSRDFLPRPEQLYSEAQIFAAEGGWTSRRRVKIYVSKLPCLNLNIQPYVADPLQDAHMNWVVEQIKFRENPVPLLRRFIVEEPLLDERFAATRFTPEQMRRALN
jgi:hypothetical protein